MAEIQALEWFLAWWVASHMITRNLLFCPASNFLTPTTIVVLPAIGRTAAPFCDF
jgi:hypothetical protein